MTLSRLFAPILATAAIFATNSFADIIVKSGEKIGFLGDSITQAGWGNPKGYARLVIAGLAANGVNAEAIPAGISGHKSNDMLARLDRDVLSKKPQWMTLSCGVNDVWHGARGVALDDYKKNISAIMDKAAESGVKVVVTTATVIHENLESPENQKLAPYNAFLRTLAAERKAPLADLNAMFHERIKAENKPGKNTVTSDGVHMNYEGDKIMARGVLKAFGCDEGQLKKADEAWAAIK
jgi:lysophospholipase L1-like esterase